MWKNLGELALYIEPLDLKEKQKYSKIKKLLQACENQVIQIIKS